MEKHLEVFHKNKKKFYLVLKVVTEVKEERSPVLYGLLKIIIIIIYIPPYTISRSL